MLWIRAMLTGAAVVAISSCSSEDPPLPLPPIPEAVEEEVLEEDTVEEDAAEEVAGEEEVSEEENEGLLDP